MAVVHKTVFLGYSAEQMFDLVANVADYPKFLPWCGAVKVLEQSDTKLVASVGINFHGVKQSFTTANTFTLPMTWCNKRRMITTMLKTLTNAII